LLSSVAIAFFHESKLDQIAILINGYEGLSPMTLLTVARLKPAPERLK